MPEMLRLSATNPGTRNVIDRLGIMSRGRRWVHNACSPCDGSGVMPEA